MVQEWWPLASHWVVSACEYSDGRYEAKDILDILNSGKMQLWLVLDGYEVQAAVIAEVITYPKMREGRVIVCTGVDSHKWIHLIDRVETWAVHNGCRKIRLICRPGWEKVMKHYDYKKTHVELEKELGNVH